MSLERMISLHPDVAGTVTEALVTAARHAMLCSLFCTSCADACVAEQMDMRQCIRTCLDCADICGATSCGGDYSNLEPLRFRCSINTTTQVLKNCSYVFGGSYEVVNPTTGTIKVNARTFSCHISVTGIKLSDFESTLTAAGSTAPLQRTLPGKSESIYSSLIGCI